VTVLPTSQGKEVYIEGHMSVQRAPSQGPKGEMQEGSSSAVVEYNKTARSECGDESRRASGQAIFVPPVDVPA
jgi:hypothetical protein